ncbi:PanM family protein, partial [bacterium]|nr:PanM family protein [bacterium]
MQYIGKDVLTQGSLLHLNSQVAWKRLRSRAKQGIRKAQKAGIRVEESRDLVQMAKVWYNPDTLTSRLTPDQRMFLAYVEDQLVGGIIVTPVTRNTLFYHYGGTNELGRTIEANAYLFWHIVETFQDTPYEYLDVGVSFRTELQHYFQKYCTQPYPILFRPPPEEVRPRIGLDPVAAADLDWTERQGIAVNTQLFEFFESEFTYLPSWPFALQSALRALHLPDHPVIGVWASVGEASYIETLERQFGDQFTFRARDRSAAARVACHRWGVPCLEAESLCADSIPVIEDCRDLLLGRATESHPGSLGRYAVYDFSRWFPMQFGSVLAGEYFSDRDVWDRFHCLDVTKRNMVRELLQIHWPRRMDYAAARAANWRRYAELF